MKVYGLTGGIASGKSEAARLFRERGIPVIDADAIGHEVIEPGGPAYAGVVDAFGPEILDGKRVDRVKLGRRVFGDAEALQRLNELVHPAVRAVVGERLAALMDQGHDAALIEAALHAEDGRLGDGLDGLILVDCPEAIRLRRLVQHRDMSEAEAMERIRAQTPPEKKRPLATFVIDNSGNLGALERGVGEVVDALMRSAAD